MHLKHPKNTLNQAHSFIIFLISNKVVRVSGPNALTSLALLDRDGSMEEYRAVKREDIIAKFQIEPRKTYFKEIFENRETAGKGNTKQIIDKSLVVFFSGPKSFTGEGSRDITCIICGIEIEYFIYPNKR